MTRNAVIRRLEAIESLLSSMPDYEGPYGDSLSWLDGQNYQPPEREVCPRCGGTGWEQGLMRDAHPNSTLARAERLGQPVDFGDALSREECCVCNRAKRLEPTSIDAGACSQCGAWARVRWRLESNWWRDAPECPDLCGGCAHAAGYRVPRGSQVRLSFDGDRDESGDLVAEAVELDAAFYPRSPSPMSAAEEQMRRMYAAGSYGELDQALCEPQS